MEKEKRNIFIFTSESVTEGHPDKVCDKISDSILDAYLEQDKNSYVACEVCATTGLVMVMGEVTSKANVDIQKIVRETVDEIGYNRGKFGFDAENLAVLVALDKQSPDIAMGVNNDDGAGDQGMMFGFASNETPEYMPAPVMFAHRLTRRLTECRKSKMVDFLRPDGKAQVSVEYDNNKIARIDNVIVSTQHSEDVTIEEVREFILEKVIKEVLPNELLDENTKYYINPTGRFVIGGPKGDSGLTGRKIIVDTYGGYARHGGGAFSGKDPSKVDRSGAYMARYIAKNLVAAGFADKLEIGLSYAIGVAEPTSIMVKTYGTANATDHEIIEAIRKTFVLTPKGIINHLNLRRPIYKLTTNYGHFGKDNLPWEQLDKVEKLQKYLNSIVNKSKTLIFDNDEKIVFNETKEFLKITLSKKFFNKKIVCFELIDKETFDINYFTIKIEDNETFISFETLIRIDDENIKNIKNFLFKKLDLDRYLLTNENGECTINLFNAYSKYKENFNNSYCNGYIFEYNEMLDVNLVAKKIEKILHLLVYKMFIFNNHFY